MNAFATLSWGLLALGVLVDAYNAALLVMNLVQRRSSSAVWVVPVVCYAMSAQLCVAAERPLRWGLLAAAVAVHALLLMAHVAMGRPK